MSALQPTTPETTPNPNPNPSFLERSAGLLTALAALITAIGTIATVVLTFAAQSSAENAKKSAATAALAAETFQWPTALYRASGPPFQILPNPKTGAYITGDPIIIRFDEKIVDTNRSVQPGLDWKFLAPVDGIYTINALVTFGLDGHPTPYGFYDITLYKNSKPWSGLASSEHKNQTGWAISLNGGDTLFLNKADSISIRASIRATVTDAAGLQIYNSPAASHFSAILVNPCRTEGNCDPNRTAPASLPPSSHAP